MLLASEQYGMHFCFICGNYDAVNHNKFIVRIDQMHLVWHFTFNLLAQTHCRNFVFSKQKKNQKWRENEMLLFSPWCWLFRIYVQMRQNKKKNSIFRTFLSSMDSITRVTGIVPFHFKINKMEMSENCLRNNLQLVVTTNFVSLISISSNERAKEKNSSFFFLWRERFKDVDESKIFWNVTFETLFFFFFRLYACVFSHTRHLSMEFFVKWFRWHVIGNIVAHRFSYYIVWILFLLFFV